MIDVNQLRKGTTFTEKWQSLSRFGIPPSQTRARQSDDPCDRA